MAVINDEILTVQEAAQLLKISEKTAYEWIHIDGFPCVRIGRCRRIPRSLLMEWVRDRARKDSGG